MKHGFVNVRLSCPALKLGDPAYNANILAEEIARAAEAGVEVLAFPELSLCGATAGDAFLQKAFLNACLNALEGVVAATAKNNVLVFLGLPVSLNAKCYNCAAAVANGKLLGLVPKTRLSAAEQRYFCVAGYGDSVLFHGEGVALSAEQLFEEESNPEISVGVTFGYDNVKNLAGAGATVIINLAAEPEGVGRSEEQKTLCSALSLQHRCAVASVNAGIYESAGDAVYSGACYLYENGALLSEKLPFKEGYAEGEIDAQFLHYARKRGGYEEVFSCSSSPARFVSEQAGKRVFCKTPFLPRERSQAELILNMQAHALAKRVTECTPNKKMVVGISGGLDSTLALLASVRAADCMHVSRKNVLAYTMPGFGTTHKTKNNALSLMQELGVSYREICISDAVKQHFKDIGHDESVHNAAYENAQARYRTMVLMDIANDEGGLVVGTGDMSELALGWCTFNGDHMSNYAVNCGIPKTLVKYLVSYEAENLGGEAGRVLKDICATEISPELLPPDKEGNIAQKTEELVGSYELNDFILYHFLGRGASPSKIYALAAKAFAGEYQEGEIKARIQNFFKRFFSQQFKRGCAPDGIGVGDISLSPRGGLNLPSDMAASVWLNEAEQL